MIALILAAALCVERGATLEQDVDVGFRPIYGGTLYSDSLPIARATGSVAPKSSIGRVTVYGEREGEASLYLSFVSGISVYRWRIAPIIVGETLALTVSAPSIVREESPATLVAHVTGARPATVAWYEGEAYLGIGNELTVTLPRGIHRIRAEAWNDCGTVTSEVEISVGTSRRRATRH
jgi:hypothetical protein